jgi:hypothetical protein
MGSQYKITTRFFHPKGVNVLSVKEARQNGISLLTITIEMDELEDSSVQDVIQLLHDSWTTSQTYVVRSAT